MGQETTEYRYVSANPSHSSAYLWPAMQRVLREAVPAPKGRRAFDLGCGSGATAGQLAAWGFDVVGVDSSLSGIDLAKAAYPSCRFAVASVYDDLAAVYGSFPVVVSLEVIEHLYDPRAFARRLFALVEPGGIAVVSTPYHGYLKNLALAASGRLDAHFTALWDGGHIKFFSPRTLGKLLREAGFQPISFLRVGRIPAFAKSMIAVARRPA